MTDAMGYATFTSDPGASPMGGVTDTNAAPGAAGPGGNMSMQSALLWLIGGTAAVSVTIGYLARKGVRPEIGRFDAVDALWNATTTALVFEVFKLLAYRYHGHKLSQAVLTVV